MIFLLKLLPFFHKEERTLNVVVRYLKRLLLVLQVLSFGLPLGMLLIGFLRGSTVRLRDFMVLTLIMYLTSSLGLYIGLWRNHLVSRQLIKKEERKKEIAWNVKISFGMATWTLFFCVSYALYLFAVPSIEGLRSTSDTFLRYSNWKLNYRTLSVFLGSPLPFVPASVFNSILLLAPALWLPVMLFHSYQYNIVPYHRLVEQWISSRYFKHPAINRLVQDRDSKGLANLRIGYDSITKDEVIMNADTRSLNTAYFGLIGTGKSSAQAKPEIMNDTTNLIYYIRLFSDFVLQKRQEIANQGLEGEEAKLAEKAAVEEWFTKGIGRNYTNGFYVNEPSGDLIRDAKEIILRSGLPEEIIWMVSPPDLSSDAINILDNDPDDAAALTADLFRSFNAGDGSAGNNFFLDAEESHTRVLVTLLKYTSQIPELDLNKRLNGGAPTLSEFYELLRDKRVLFTRLSVLKIIVRSEERKYQEANEAYQHYYQTELQKYLDSGGHPARFDSHLPYALKLEKAKIEHYFSKVDTLRSTISYFDERMRTERDGSVYFTFDANISGLQNTIIKLASDPRVRRVFFQQSQRSVDGLLKMGGVLLVNSARAELGEMSSKMVGQVAEIVMQSGAFKRLPNLSPIFPFIGDEKNSIIMGRDRGFLDQNRKYRTPVTHFYQNYEQVIATIGRENANALFESYRNTFVFQQQGEAAIRYMTNRSGTKLVLEESHRFGESNVSAGEYGSGVQTSETLVEKPKLTSSDVQSLEEMEILGIMVVDNEVSDPLRITSVPNFKLPMFSDKEFVAPFNMDNPKDREAYQIWREKIEEWYIDNLQENRYYNSDFTDYEWQQLMSFVHPLSVQNDLFESVLEEDIKEFSQTREDETSEQRVNQAREDLEKSKTITEEEVEEDFIAPNPEPSQILQETRPASEDEVMPIADVENIPHITAEKPSVRAQNVPDMDEELEDFGL